MTPKTPRHVGRFTKKSVMFPVIEVDCSNWSAGTIAEKVDVKDDKILIDLADGRNLAVPLSWYPRLLHATEAERRNYQLLEEGRVIQWPDLDEHVGVEDLTSGQRSGESAESFSMWLASRSS